jgi:peptide/nickel transport system substrate-binding protein
VQEETAVEVIDRYTITFHLNAPNPLLPRAMAQCTPSVYDYAAIRDAESPDDPFKLKVLSGRSAGFGPYRLGDRNENEVVLLGNENYWKGAPRISEVHVKKAALKEAALDALLAGETQLLTGISLDDANRLRSEKNIEIVTLEGTPGLVIHLDTEEPEFADPIVRQAVACAIPYQTIIQTAYLGLGRRWRSYVQPQAPGYLDEWPYEEDLVRARALLKASSFPDGFETRLVPRGGKEVEIAARLIQAALAKIGVTVAIDSETVRARPGQNAKANPGPMMLRGGGAGGRGNRVFDPIYALYHDHGPGRMRLFRYTFENQEFYEALRSIPTAGSPEKWEAAAHTTQRILNADAVTIPIAAYRSFVAHSSDLGGYLWYPDNRMAFYDLYWR